MRWRITSLGRSFGYLELNGDTDLFGDRSLRVIRLTGHTPGSQGLIVELPHRGRVAFVGDAAHLREQVSANVPQVSDWDVEAKLLSYQRLRALRRAGIDVFLSHDADDFAALPSGGTYWE